MEYFLTDEEKQLKEKARAAAETLVKPFYCELDEKAEFPMEIIKEMGKRGLLKIFVPTEYGGTGAKVMDMCIACEEVSRICAGVATAYAVNALGSGPIVFYGNEDQKRKYLPKIATGELLCAFGLTEAQAGSDVANIQTTARKEDAVSRRSSLRKTPLVSPLARKKTNLGSAHQLPPSSFLRSVRYLRKLSWAKRGWVSYIRCAILTEHVLALVLLHSA
jgi:alkylation response protein AidB-like acyl-CoA dehydrogenase